MHPLSLFCVFLTLAVVTLGHPNTKEVSKNESNQVVACPEGEIAGADGKCAKVITPNPKPALNATTDAEKLAKKEKKKARHQRKRKLQKKLDKELKEIKKLVLEGLEKGTVNITDLTCPEGQEINEIGECAQIEVKEIVNGTETTVAKKSKKSQRLQKKLERELELVLKKEIQNELKKKRRNKKRKDAEKHQGPEPGSNNVTTPLPPVASPKILPEELPICEGADTTGEFFRMDST